jgi:CysZ protein
MISAFARSLSQLLDARFLRVLALGSVITILLSLVIAVAAGWGVNALLGSVNATGMPGWLAGSWHWIDTLLATLGGAGLFIGFLFLFPAVATAVMAIFLDDVVDAVEARFYPQARAPRPTGIFEGARLGISSALRLILINMLLAPVYLLLLVTGIGPFVLYLLVNGYLLGRDYLQMVAIRHLDSREKNWRKQHRSLVFGHGVLVSLLFLVPVANFFAPLMGAAMATHLYHASSSLSD